MSKSESIRGVLKVFAGSVREDWGSMDKKFYRLLFGAIGFTAMALFWYFFLRNISPFGF